MFVVALACLSVGVGAACYDGGGGFTLANWPRCTEASGNLSVYSGLSQDGQFVKLGLHAKGHTRGHIDLDTCIRILVQDGALWVLLGMVG